MAINRYQGNTGKMIKMQEPQIVAREQTQPEILPKRPRQNISPPRNRGNITPVNFGGLTKIFSSISGKTRDIIGTDAEEKQTKSVLSKLAKIELDTDDLIILLIIWLMYRDSHDEELLIVMAVILFS